MAVPILTLTLKLNCAIKISTLQFRNWQDQSPIPVPSSSVGTMQRLGFLASAKRKLSEKAQAALDDSTTGMGTGKHKKHLNGGTTSAAKKARVDQGDSIPTTKPARDSTQADQGHGMSKSASCQAIVRTEEEDALHGDVEVIVLDADEDANSNSPKINPEAELEKLMTEWTSPVYAFFQPRPTIIDVDRRRAYDFKCAARSCKVKVRRYTDKKDA